MQHAALGQGLTQNFQSSLFVKVHNIQHKELIREMEEKYWNE